VGQDAIGAVVLLDDVTESTMMERSKDEFFSIASHELRTPLTAIRGNTSMMLEYYKDDIKNEDLKEMITDIHGSSQRLIEIVNDFLDTSRLEQGRMEFNLQKVSLAELIGAVVKDTSTVTKERLNEVRIDASINKLPQVYADPDKLKQVLYNLIGNSIKFTEKGKITISSVLEGDKVRISIIDQGRGIGADSRKLLFRKFQQASNSILTRDATKGTGLGLYISKMILENMGGTIRLDSSEVGKGSVFSFTVPIAQASTDDSRFLKKSLPEAEKIGV
ncbi:HAMP domain-containing histidine kinase, partial [Candidatus Saccharibacteria bacterium]|nr:HAMP domain-containing histidine kinase [Candidatus Saccharibacteria bacterium]